MTQGWLLQSLPWSCEYYLRQGSIHHLLDPTGDSPPAKWIKPRRVRIRHACSGLHSPSIESAPPGCNNCNSSKKPWLGSALGTSCISIVSNIEFVSKGWEQFYLWAIRNSLSRAWGGHYEDLLNKYIQTCKIPLDSKKHMQHDEWWTSFCYHWEGLQRSSKLCGVRFALSLTPFVLCS